MTASIKKRDSNMELARIVAMAMIMVGHFFSHGLGSASQPSPNDMVLLDWNTSVILAIRAICTGGVSLFMLISGFYGIKLRWKSVISFFLLCVFYNGVAYFVNTPFENITVKGILDIFLISRTNHWFFKGYWWILLTSPILNLALNRFSLRSLRVLEAMALVLITVSSCILGNPQGNTALFLYCLYFTGGYLRKETLFNDLSKKSLVLIWAIIKILMIACSIVVYNVFHKEYGILLQNNSPFVILTAVTLFMFFRKVNISSSFVNGWASTIVACLFIQDVIFCDYLYACIGGAYASNGLSAVFFASIAALVAAIFIAAFLIEWPRKYVAGKIASFLAPKFSKIVDIETSILKESV